MRNVLCFMDIPPGALHKETLNVQVMVVLVLTQSGCLTGSSCVLSFRFGQRRCEDGAVGINLQKWGRV